MRQIVDVYENERYAFSGWSTGSLLPTDRSAYSLKDGSEGWPTLSEAEPFFLSKGWAWFPESKWRPDVHPSNTDDDGWIYSTSFGSIEEGVPAKGIVHFVRRRRLVREKVFDLNIIHDISNISTCYCDSEEIENISLQLLQSISSSSVLRFPNHISIPKTNILKNELIKLLCLESPSEVILSIPTTRQLSRSVSAPTQSSHTVIPTVLVRTLTGTGSISTNSHLNIIKAKIEQFAKEGRTLWSTAAAAFVTEDPMEGLIKRTVEITDIHFTYHERTEIAKLIIILYDNDFQYHCNHAVKDCEETRLSEDPVLCNELNCLFAPYHCVNKDCNVLISKNHRGKHDAVCPNKLVDCHRACGELVVRKLMHVHMNSTCEMKPTTCPFYEVGCKVELVQKDLSSHVTDSMPQHLLLALECVKDQQKTIQVMGQKIKILEEEATRQLAGLNTVQGSVLNMKNLIEISENKQNKNILEEISKLEKRTANRFSELNSSFQTDINRISRGLAESKQTGYKK